MKTPTQPVTAPGFLRRASQTRRVRMITGTLFGITGVISAQVLIQRRRRMLPHGSGGLSGISGALARLLLGNRGTRRAGEPVV
jgi:hypothetical protein